MSTISFKTAGPYRHMDELRAGTLFQHDGQWYTSDNTWSGTNVVTGDCRDFSGLVVRAAKPIDLDRCVAVEWLERDAAGKVSQTRLGAGDLPHWAQEHFAKLWGPALPSPIVTRATGQREPWWKVSQRLFVAARRIAGLGRYPRLTYTHQNLSPEMLDDMAWILMDSARRLRAGELRFASGAVCFDDPNGGLTITSNLTLEKTP